MYPFLFVQCFSCLSTVFINNLWICLAALLWTLAINRCYLKDFSFKRCVHALDPHLIRGICRIIINFPFVNHETPRCLKWIPVNLAFLLMLFTSFKGSVHAAIVATETDSRKSKNCCKHDKLVRQTKPETAMDCGDATC